jgi:hypothetical protein
MDDVPIVDRADLQEDEDEYVCLEAPMGWEGITMEEGYEG